MTKERSNKQKQWIKFLAIFAPLFGLSFFALKTFGVWKTLPIMIMLLAITLLYQRFVKQRSWNAIMWGNETSVRSSPHTTSE